MLSIELMCYVLNLYIWKTIYFGTTWTYNLSQVDKNFNHYTRLSYKIKYNLIYIFSEYYKKDSFKPKVDAPHRLLV